jgi:hypothetical protein
MNSDDFFYSESDPSDPQEQDNLAYQKALDETLGDEPRSVELRDMVMTLKMRYRNLASELDTLSEGPERQRLQRELNKLAEQIKVLAEEAEITRFVEDAVRVGIEMRRMESS